jgi:hypothetical protein
MEGFAMRSFSLFTALAATALSAMTSSAWSQMPDSVQRSSSPQGFQVQGNTPMGAGSTNTNTGNLAKDGSSSGSGPVASGKSTVQIQGTTRVNAAATSTTAAAIGQGNKASNELGAIGNK